MKKNLLITNNFPPQNGEIENYNENICRHFPTEEISVLTKVRWQSESFDSSQKYKINRADLSIGKLPPRFSRLKAVISNIVKAETITQIIFGDYSSYCLVGRKFTLPFYLFGHGADLKQINNGWGQKRALRKIFKHYNFKKYLATSKYLAEAIVKIVNDKNKIEVVYPGIDYEIINQPIADLSNKKSLLGLDDNDTILLSVGPVETYQNYETIIKLMPEMIAQIPQLKYVIVGGGSDLERLKSVAEGYGVKYQVIFTGELPNNSAIGAMYYQLAHIYTNISSRIEDVDIYGIEAQATKTAVITSKFGSNAEVVADKETGLLVDPAKLDQIKDAVYKLALDKELWLKLTTAGQEQAKKFDWKIKMEEIKKILE